MTEFFGGLLNTLTYVGAVYFGFSLFERLAPAELNQPWRPLVFNLILTPLLLGLSGLLVIWLHPWIRDWINPPVGQNFSVAFPKGVAGSTLAVMTVIAVNDFFYYWWHRWQHTNRWLWAQHALHHSERSLNVCASLRHHWLEDPIRLFIQVLPIGFLFAFTPPDVAWVASVLALWPFVIHLNLRVSFGPFTGVFAGPQYHRIHHSILPQHMDKNFAAMFPLWDRLFGTQYLPARNEYPPTGIIGVEHRDLGAAMLSPFKDWARFVSQKLGGNKPLQGKTPK